MDQHGWAELYLDFGNPSVDPVEQLAERFKSQSFHCFQPSAYDYFLPRAAVETETLGKKIKTIRIEDKELPQTEGQVAASSEGRSSRTNICFSGCGCKEVMLTWMMSRVTSAQ